MRSRAGVAAGAALLLLAARAGADVLVTDERLLTSDAGTDRDAKASGATTAFVSERGGTRDVFVLDGSGALAIAAGGAGQQYHPDIDGTRVVYVDDGLGNLNVGVADIVAGTRRLLTVDAARDADPAIDGSRVVFTSTRGGSHDVMLYELATETLSFLTLGGGDELTPAIDGELVAWTVFQNGSFDVIAREIGGAAFAVAAGSGDEVDPSVSGQRIAYLLDDDVMVYDRSTGATLRITDDAFDRNALALDGDLVAWGDDRHGNYDLFLHDLASGATYTLTTDPFDQFLGDLDGSRVVFHDRRLDGFDVWQIEFTLEPDADGDGVADAVDNCRRTANPDQADAGGLGSATPDGVGDACQNGDWNDDGASDLADVARMRRHLAGLDALDPRLPPEP